MRKLACLGIAVFALGLMPQPSEAAMAWKCAKTKCFWVEHNGPVPDYAANWGAPREQGCYWSYRRLSKKWREVCPSTIVH
jgi:hypothetical protein